MIIAPRFDGDNAEDLQIAQSRLFPDALGIMIGGARSALGAAERLLETSTPLGDIVRTNRYDSGFPGLIHDQLAALWRAQHDLLQAELPIDGRDDQSLAREWLEWLRSRVANMDPGHHRTLLLAAYDNSPETSERVKTWLAELRLEVKQTAERRARQREEARQV